MDPSIQLSKEQCPKTPEEAVKMCRVPYQEAIGLLNYCAIATHPDIAFSASLLTQFMEIFIGKWLKVPLRHKELEIDVWNNRKWSQRLHRYRQILTGTLTHHLRICISH